MRSDTNKQGAQGELHAKLLSGTTVPGTPHRPPYLKSHVVPPRPHPPTAQKPRNINDPISKPETSSRELRAKLLSCTRFLGRPTRRPPRVLQGNRGVTAALVGGGRARARTRTPDWRPPRGLRGNRGVTAALVGGGRARAGLEIDHSERSSRVAISRAGRRPRAHRADTPKHCRHNRQPPPRLLHNSPHGSSPRRPWRICYDVRPVASHARSYRLG